jgi:hypothetical protein
VVGAVGHGAEDHAGDLFSDREVGVMVGVV